MINPQPEQRPEVLSSEGVQSQLWRRVLAIASQYEDSWQHDQSIDPIAFAKLHPEIPQNILSLELTRLRDELVADTKDSVVFEESVRRFTIIDTLRTGGMGVVYLAYDHACNREVALKKIRPEFRDDPHVIRRFRAEAELTAALEHPGIIPIYARGADSQGEDFYAMRLVGRSGASTLAKAIHEFHEDLSRETEPGQKPRTQRLDQFRQMIRTLMTVADTIAYTHSCGIVHRDIKPANILLGPYGEALIADWGLARKLNDPLENDSPDPAGISNSRLNQNSPEFTSFTADAGTPGYAAPEVSLGLHGSAIKLADIYSLGATLHCIIYGSSPNEHPPDVSARRKHLAKLGDFCPTIHYLEAIAVKAMANEYSQRYPSALELQADLQRWIAGEPVSARREGSWEQAIRWPSRHRSAATGLATALAITLLAGCSFLWYQSAQKSLLDRQAQQLRSALDDSARLLIETRKAKTLTEQANQVAQADRRIAVASQRLAQERESLAFEGLLRVQEILLTNQAAFQSERLLGVQEQLVTQMKETLAGILDNLSENSAPQPQTLGYLQVLVHRLSAMERLAGRPDQALAAIDQACAWMQRCLRIEDLPDATEADLQLRIGALRSHQGNIAMQSGRVAQALPAVEESITRISGLLKSQRLGVKDKKEAVAALVQSYTALSAIMQTRGQFDKAKADQLKALELLDGYRPDTFTAAMASAQAHYGMAILHIQSQAPEQASEQFERTSEAILLAEKLNDEPLSLEFHAYRSQLAYNRSNLLVSLNQMVRAIEILRQQVQIDTQAVSDFHANQIILEAWHRNTNFLQGLYVQAGRQSDAVDLCRTWIEVSEKLLTDYPLSEPAIHCAIQANHFAGHLDQQMNQSDEALNRYRKALLIYDQAAATQLTSPRLEYQKVELEMHLLQSHYQIGSDDQAASIFQRALEAAQRLRAMAQTENQELTAAIQQLQRGIATMRSANDLELANTSEANLKSAGL